MNYLMIDRRSKVGNCVLFWAKDHKGYTTNIQEAHVFDEVEARKIEGGRSTDCAIPFSEALEIAVPRVDFQYIDRKYYNPKFSYFSDERQKTDSEKEISSLKHVIREMRDTVNRYFEMGINDSERLEEALDNIECGEKAEWE